MLYPTKRFLELLHSNYVSVHQGRNEVRWRLGQEAGLAPPYSKLRSFGSKCAVLKKVFVTFLGLSGAPRSHSVPP